MNASKELIKLVENNFFEQMAKKEKISSENNQEQIEVKDVTQRIGMILSTLKKDNINIGDILRIEYRITDGEKERIQAYEGLVICKKNRRIGKSFTIRRNVEGVGVEQVFLFYSPKIASITCKQESKIRRAKLYYLRNLKGKATRLKIKR